MSSMCSFWRTLSAYMLRHTALKPTAISRVLQALMSTRPQVSRPRPQHSRPRPRFPKASPRHNITAFTHSWSHLHPRPVTFLLPIVNHIVDTCLLTKFDGGLNLSTKRMMSYGWNLQRLQHSRKMPQSLFVNNNIRSCTCLSLSVCGH